MSDQVWRASAPSNIALIKYMGKTSASENRPSNASLSWTLEHLRTFVELSPAEEDRWQALPKAFESETRLAPIELSEKRQQKFLTHLQFLKSVWGIEEKFLVKSANNFPSDCGLASSASSFAALTLAVYEVAKDLKRADENKERLSKLSRQGSGSSCRSLFSPWALWENEGAVSVDLPYQDLLHISLVVDSSVKEVSSREAHTRVSESLLFQGRPERAEKRLKALQENLRSQNWRECFEICWAEFWDMHALFETSQPSFGYMTSKSLAVLSAVKQEWKEMQDGPLVTMDAGANVHLLYRADQAFEAESFTEKLPEGVRALKSWEFNV